MIAPPVEFWPNNVPWGPRSTSILSISIKSVNKEKGDAIKTPSMWKATEGAAIAFWLVSLPTPLIEITVLYPSFFETVTPGTIALKSTKDSTFLATKSESDSADTACETSWRLSLRFSAETITSSIDEFCAYAPKESIVNARKLITVLSLKNFISFLYPLVPQQSNYHDT